MKNATWREKWLDINGLHLHYLDWGHDRHQTILLLHGFMAHAHVWDDFAFSFRSRYHVVALDQRGHGESQWSEEGAYTIEDHFVDLTNFIETLGLKNIILIGHSMGGRNALFYTAYNSDNVERLVLVDARPANSQQSSEALKNLLINLPLQAGSFEETVRKVQAVYPHISREMCYHIVIYGYKQMPDGKFGPKYDKRMGLQSERGGYATEDLRLVMKNITCPTLVIRGEESPFLSRQDVQEMCEIIPQAEWKEIPKSAHMPAQENSEIFNSAILDFISH